MAVGSRTRILWVQVWGLAAVQGAIALTWVIYNLYLLDLLTQFGFSQGLATGLLIVENILAAIMEPLMGSLSDRAQQWIGTRFPFVSFGVVAASACFIGIPVIFVFGITSGPARWLLPGMLVLWALAMTVFRSPAMSLLGRYAFATELPQAASILTLVGGLAGAMGPLAGGFILSLGPAVAFTIGSVVMLLAAAALRSVNPGQSVNPDENPGKGGAVQPLIDWGRLIPSLGLVFGAGVGVAMGFRFLMSSFPTVLETRLPGANVGLILGGIFVALAVTALPLGTLASRWGNRPSMIVGLGGMALFCLLISVIQSVVLAAGIAIALGSTFSLVSNSTIPFALSMVPAEKAGLGTGIYFSGGAVASSLFGILTGGSGLSPSVGILLSAIAFLVAGLCVAGSVKFSAAQPINS